MGRIFIFDARPSTGNEVVLATNILKLIYILWPCSYTVIVMAVARSNKKLYHCVLFLNVTHLEEIRQDHFKINRKRKQTAVTNITIRFRMVYLT